MVALQASMVCAVLEGAYCLSLKTTGKWFIQETVDRWNTGVGLQDTFNDDGGVCCHQNVCYL